MASIDKLTLGGTGFTDSHGIPYRSAIAYLLLQPSPLSLIEIVDGWEVQIRQDCSTIVARSTKSLNKIETIELGTESIQRCLDILSFEQRFQLELSNLGDTHVVLFNRADQVILELFGTNDFSLGVDMSVTHTDKDGNVVPDTPPPQSIWTPALRFYRLSQSSSNLYEAYRNLWLGLETLLSTIQPMKINEGERKWLRRALGHVITQINLKQYLPNQTTDVVSYLMVEQYEAMRCNLFHAKPDSPIDIPTIPDPEKTATAYAQLIMIWRAIAQHFCHLRTKGSGVVTYEGFKLMMDRALSGKLTMVCTDDPTRPSKSDIVVSPGGRDVIEFDVVAYQGEITPGRVAIKGVMNVSNHSKLRILHRVCALIQETLLNVAYVNGGLDLSGIDEFVTVQMFRLHNKGLPKTLF
jgi:hypothetical protein